MKSVIEKSPWDSKNFKKLSVKKNAKLVANYEFNPFDDPKSSSDINKRFKYNLSNYVSKVQQIEKNIFALHKDYKKNENFKVKFEYIESLNLNFHMIQEHDNPTDIAIGWYICDENMSCAYKYNVDSNWFNFENFFLYVGKDLSEL